MTLDLASRARSLNLGRLNLGPLNLTNGMSYADSIQVRRKAT